MNEFLGLKHMFGLKHIYRAGDFKERKESSAEHLWGCMILAEYFLKFEKKLDEVKVMKLLMYHDLVEVEAGDTYFLDEEGRKDKKERELLGFNKLMEKIPKLVANDYKKYFEEFELGKSKEARFAIAIDKLEPMIFWLGEKKIWREYKFSSQILNNSKRKYLEEFPSIIKMYDDIIEYLIKEDYIDD